MTVYKVLIVEDDPMVAMINEQYVTRTKGFTVAGSCRNGQDAIEFLEKNEVNLVIMDVFMPYMDGIETLKQIRGRKFDVEVIMVTAANDTPTLEQAMHLGVLDFLIKPFAFERFQVALEKFASKESFLKGTSVLNQNFIDNIIATPAPVKKDGKGYPKGIQEKTLKNIIEYFESASGWQSGDFIAEKLGISIVTVRHYLGYLVQTGQIEETINYETGGRPSMLYKSKSVTGHNTDERLS